MVRPWARIRITSDNVCYTKLLRPGYTLIWSGQYEYMERAKARLKLVIPMTLFIIFLLLYLNFRNITESLIT